MQEISVDESDSKELGPTNIDATDENFELFEISARFGDDDIYTNYLHNT